MAFNKKPIGSAEELETYGVWVKSEPQDLTASLAEAVNFDAEAVPYEHDYAAGFGDFGNLDTDIPEVGAQAGEIDSENDDYDDGMAADFGKSSEAASTQLLMKIADELSSIRSELNTLKKEFAGIRAGGASGVKADPRHRGFFPEDEDEKIALTGDEMESFFTSNDFTVEENLGFDAMREADETALKELAGEDAGAETEAMNLDYDNLGIDLENDIEETQEDFSTSALSFEEMAALETVEQEDDIQEIVEEFAPLEPIDEDEELRDLRIEGASPFTPAPDNVDYLEADNFVLDDSMLNDSSLETPLAENDLNINDNILLDYPPPDSGEGADAGLDDANFDISLDDIPVEGLYEGTLDLSDVVIDEQPAAPAPVEDAFDDQGIDIAVNIPELVLEEQDTVVEPAVQEPALSADAPSMESVADDISFDDDLAFELDDLDAKIDDLSSVIDLGPDTSEIKSKDNPAADNEDRFAQVIPEGFEVNAVEAAVSIYDEMEAFVEDELPIGGEEKTPDIAAGAEAAAENPALPSALKGELKSVLSYMDHLLESLPEDKIEEFAKSEFFDSYKKIFKELGLV